MTEAQKLRVERIEKESEKVEISTAHGKRHETYQAAMRAQLRLKWPKRPCHAITRPV